MNFGVCATVYLFLLALYTCCEAHRSSGNRIIDTVKKAIEGASHNRRQKRDVSPGLSLESLLLPNPRHSHVVEFDLILNDDQYKTVSAIGKHDVYSRSSRRRSKRKAVRHSIYHWPYAEVPYEIHSSVDAVSSIARHRIKKAMIHWQRHTCIKFVEYNPLKHRNYVRIQKGQWCASKLGMAGGVQPLYIALGCLDTGTIIHELGHTIGWVHEQARPDRDNYITIKWGLVSTSYKSQYIKHGTDFVNTYGVPYDYDSIMHYPSYGELITKDPSAQHRIGQRNRLSFYDIQLANVMYKCPERAGCDTSSFKCIGGGFVDHTCKCVCPKGDSKSCTVTNSIFKPQPSVLKTTASPKPACRPWKSYDNFYIPGRNDDVGFALTVDQCKERCVKETMFKCRSFDYWKQRKQCYLSSATASSLRTRFSRDSRMVHYVRTDCPPVKPSSPLTIPPGVTSGSGRNATTTIRPVAPTKPAKSKCPFEYTYTGTSCIRPLTFPLRPVHIAEVECDQKLGAVMWEAKMEEIESSDLSKIIGYSEEYWVKVKGFKSDNVMASFFDFCPYITKEQGKIVLKDTLCFKQKGFICQLRR